MFDFVCRISLSFQVVNVPRLGPSGPVLDDEACCSAGSNRELRHSCMSASVDSQSTATSEGSTAEDYFPLKVRGGTVRRPAGYQVSCGLNLFFKTELYWWKTFLNF